MDIAELGFRVDSSDVKRGERDLDSMGKTGDRTGQKVERFGGIAKKSFGGVALAVGSAAAAMLSFGAVVRQISEFETSMSRLNAVSGASAAQMANMRDIARDLGSTTEFSASQAADGLNFLAMAGFNASEAMESLPAVLDLATASGLGLASAADIASNVISGFGMEASDAAKVADILAGASSRANTDVSQLGSAMSTVAPISASLGVSISDTAAAIGLLSDAGIQGERAGTALRGVMASLAGPTTEAVNVIERLGLTIEDINPATNDLASIMAKLDAAGLSTADAMKVFGREAASGALVLVDASARLGAFGKELDTVDGAASSMADTMRDNLGGDIKGLQSAISGLILALGDAGLTSALRAAVSGITLLVNGMSSAVSAVGFLADNLDVLGVGVALLASSQIPALVASTIAATTSLAAMEGGLIAGALASRGLAVAMNAIPGVAIFTGLTFALTGITRGFRESKRAAAEFESAMSGVLGVQNALNTATTMFYNEVSRANLDAMLTAAKAARDQVELALDAAKAELEAASFTTNFFGMSLGETARMADARSAIADLATQLVDAESKLSMAENAAHNFNARIAETAEVVTTAALSISGAVSGAWALGSNIGAAAQAAAILLSNLNGVPSALMQIGQQVDQTIETLQRQNRELTYQTEQGLSQQAASIKVARDAAIELALANGASIDEVAALGAEFDRQAAQAESLTGSIASLNAELQNQSAALNGSGGGGGGGGGGSVSAASAAATRQLEKLKAAMDAAVADAQTPLERYRAELQELNSVAEYAASKSVEFGRAYDNALSDMNDRLAESLPLVGDVRDAFGAWMERGFKDFKSFTGDILQSFKRMLIDMATAALQNKILIPIVTSVMGGASGVGAAGGAVGQAASGLMGEFGPSAGIGGGLSATLGSLGGGTGFLGGLGNVLSGIGTGGLSGGLGAIGTALGGVTSGATSLATAAGALALPIAGIAAAFSFFKEKTKVLGEELQLTAMGADLTAKSLTHIQKSRFWGLSRSTSTVTTDVDAGPLADAYGQIFDAVQASATALGVATDALDGHTASIKINTAGLSEQQIEQAAIAALQDQQEALAERALAAISGQSDLLRRTGETSAETLGRLNQAIAAVNPTLQMLGQAMFDLNAQGILAASDLADAAGGTAAVGQLGSLYFQNIMTQEEQLASLNAELARSLDVVPQTTEAFRAGFEEMLAAGDGTGAGELLASLPMFLERERLEAELQSVTDAISDNLARLERDAIDRTMALFRNPLSLDSDRFDNRFDASIDAAQQRRDQVRKEAEDAQLTELRLMRVALEELRKETRDIAIYGENA